MNLHPRGLTRLLARRLSTRPVTVLTGARQTGKTTLVRDLLTPEEPPPLYVSLDDPDERLRLSREPVHRLDHGTRLVILDEIQKLPGLIDAVKLLVDRRQGHRFLLLGSSQILLLRQVRETLAGRAALLSLWPLGLIERGTEAAIPETGLDRIWREGAAGAAGLASEPVGAEPARLWRARAEEQLRWGGYPELESLLEEDRPVWLRDFRATYLERDLADLGRVADLDGFVAAQDLLAARSGQVLAYAVLARELGVAVATVKRYIRFLEVSYQAYLLSPHLPDVAARLVKSPKLYWTDPGVGRHLARRPALDDGAMYETFVLDEILRWGSWQQEAPEPRFYRTHAGREVDFVLASAARFLVLEAKASTRVHRSEATALDAVLGLAPPGAEAIGVVVHRGREVERLSPRVWAVPDWRLFGPASPGE